MATFLFDKIIFGPVNSRRLGVSLGINLLPTDSKFCNFNCIYCECGWTPGQKQMKANWHSVDLIKEQLEAFLISYKEAQKPIDHFTFAGNGEPTLHPKFEDIIDLTIDLRNKYYPEAEITVLSNATMLHSAKVVRALKKVDNRILKLDSALNPTALGMNEPLKSYHIDKIVQQFEQFNGDFTLQTMFLKGISKAKPIDNTSPEELKAYYKLVQEIKPSKLMIYTIARDTPLDTIEKIDPDTMTGIAEKLRAFGLQVEVSF